MDMELLNAIRNVLKEEIEPIKDEIVIIKEQITEIKEEQKLMKQEIEEIKDEQRKMKQEIMEIKVEQKQMKQDIIEIKEEQKQIKKKIDIVFDQNADFLEFRTDVLNKLDEINENQKSIFEILGEHEVAIRNLRRRPV